MDIIEESDKKKNMPNNIVHYNSMQQTQQQSQSNLYNYQQHHGHHHYHHHHHSSHHSSPIPQIPNISSYSNHRLNNNNNNIHLHQQTLISTPLLPSNQSSAYFLDRIDLENYTTHTLKQTVENILSKTKSKGLKVKVSLPDDGLIIDNITDPNQSWIFKTSELLYFWRDPYYLNIIVVVTINRSRYHTNRPYSASIFRLRGTDSAQSFLQRAQQFFANLSTLVNDNSNVSKSNRNKSVERSIRTDNQITDHNSSSNNKSKTKILSTINEQSSSTTKTSTNRHQSPQTITTTPIRRVTRAEFDPGNTITSTTNRRTYSETTSSIDSQTTNSTKEVLSYTKKMNDDEDDKMTTISNNLSAEQVADLMRELKELRNEIASLKLEKKILPVTRSMSTSPLSKYPEYPKQTIDSSTTTSSPSSFPDITSQSEVDAETQTDFSLINHKRRQLSKKNKKTMIGSGGVSAFIKKKPQQSHTHPRNGKRTFSNSSTNTVSDQEETSAEISSQKNDSTNDTNTVHIQEQYQPIILAPPPRPILVRNQNHFIPLNNSTSYTISNGNQIISNTNSTEEGSLSQGIPVTIEKEIPKFLSNNIPSLNSEIIVPSIPIITTGNTNFRSSLENSNTSTEHIYENVPILIQANSNRESYYNIPIINVDDQQHQQQEQQQQQNQSDNYVYYTITNNRENESQQQYLISGQTISNSPPTTDNNSSEVQSLTTNIQQQKPQIISAGRHRNQPIYFANHLTNPIFNVDKQLLVNTIANQFGVDLNSPQLQQLITNQHLFVARKRTFANMVWQLTPDEETALCSSPTIKTDLIDIDTINSNNSSARSILKATKRLRSTPKRRSISWDSALE